MGTPTVNQPSVSGPGVMVSDARCFVPLLRRLLDSNDIQWIRSQGGARMAWRVKRDHVTVYFQLLSRLRKEGTFLLRNRLAAQSTDLEQMMRFEAAFRWHILRLRLAGLGFLMGGDVTATVSATGRALQAMLAPAMPPVTANSPAL